MKQKEVLPRPTRQQLEKELEWETYRERYKKTLRSTTAALIVVAAVVVLISTLLVPVMKIYGHSMTPTLVDGNLVVAFQDGSYERGDVIAFYYNNKILVKRVIGLPGEWLDIDAKGNVSIDDKKLKEDYLEEKAFGECDIELPYQVPEGRYFVMGDHRSVSSDSRSSAVGCIFEEQIIGKLVFRFWPLSDIGIVK